MSSGRPAPPQPGLTHAGQTGHLFDKQTTDIPACISDSSSDVFVPLWTCNFSKTLISQSNICNKLVSLSSRKSEGEDDIDPSTPTPQRLLNCSTACKYF